MQHLRGVQAGGRARILLVSGARSTGTYRRPRARWTCRDRISTRRSALRLVRESSLRGIMAESKWDRELARSTGSWRRLRRGALPTKPTRVRGARGGRPRSTEDIDARSPPAAAAATRSPSRSCSGPTTQVRHAARLLSGRGRRGHGRRGLVRHLELASPVVAGPTRCRCCSSCGPRARRDGDPSARWLRDPVARTSRDLVVRLIATQNRPFFSRS